MGILKDLYDSYNHYINHDGSDLVNRDQVHIRSKKLFRNYLPKLTFAFIVVVFLINIAINLADKLIK